MADEDKEDKTEQASERRIRTAWDEGQIPMGKDLAMAATMAAGFCALLIAGGYFCQALVSSIAETLINLSHPDFGNLTTRLIKPVVLALVICVCSAGAGAIVCIIQTKGRIWPNLAIPNFEKLFQGAKLARLIKTEFLVDLGISFLKAIAISGVIWLATADDFLGLVRLLQVPAKEQLAEAFSPPANAVTKVLLVLFVFAGVDFALTRHRFTTKMKMTKQEAKREYKEEEGDPLLRSRRKRKHRELAKGRPAVDVPRADALVVNPTHIAVAIRYRKEESKAPKVICKGKGHLAQTMREIARSHSIPIVQDVPLARLLYKRVKVGKEVPADTYRAIAAILAFVYRSTGRIPGGG